MADIAKEWSVGLEVETTRGTIAPDRLFEFIEALGAFHAGGASLSPDGTRIGVHLWVQAPDVKRALTAAEKAVLEALAAEALAGFALVTAEVKPWHELEEELDRGNTPDLVGVAELAGILGVSKQRVSELAATSPFPRPLATLRAGPVWERGSIGHFVETWRRTPGRPPRSGPAGDKIVAGDRATKGGGEASGGQSWTADDRRAAGEGGVPQGLPRPRRRRDARADQGVVQAR